MSKSLRRKIQRHAGLFGIRLWPDVAGLMGFSPPSDLSNRRGVRQVARRRN
jgi:hypothetical protein